jgi:hypothetical protein
LLEHRIDKARARREGKRNENQPNERIAVTDSADADQGAAVDGQCHAGDE